MWFLLVLVAYQAHRSIESNVVLVHIYLLRPFQRAIYKISVLTLIVVHNTDYVLINLINLVGSGQNLGGENICRQIM
jgi:hypothetical protein